MPSKHICKFAKHPNILVYLLLFVFLWKIIACIKIAFKLNHLTTQNNFILKIQWNIFVFVCSINERRRFFIHCFFNSKKTINTFDSHMESCTILNDIIILFSAKRGNKSLHNIHSLSECFFCGLCEINGNIKYFEEKKYVDFDWIIQIE